MDNQDWINARNQVMALKTSSMINLYEWMLYREDYDTLPFSRIANFIEKNPHWPNQTSLRKSAERNMPETLPADQVMVWFTKYPPLTGKGAIQFSNAARQIGKTNEAAAIIKTAWPNLDMNETQTKSLWMYWQNHLTITDHEMRLDELLFAHKYTLARATAIMMSKGYPELVEARIALAEDKKNVNNLINKIPEHLRKNTGLQFERLSWRRRHDEDKGALEILMKQPDIKYAGNAKEWWKERHIMIRRALEKKDYKTAYILAAHHDQSDKSARAEAEWLAGWLALRFLNQPNVALAHFNTMYENVATAISKSRGSYWAGRAEEQLGHKNLADNWYKIASQYPHTFYGQLAMKKISRPMILPLSPTPTEQDRTNMSRSDLLHAIEVANLAGMDSVHSQLTTALIAHLKTPGEYAEATRILYQAGDQTAAFRVAKAASWENIFLGRYTFPSKEHQMKQTRGNHALYHAIIRQESQFDTQARSPSGALGLMQLMPATAKETAKKLSLSHQTSWLTEKPEHNIILGATYIDGLTDRFDNFLPMAIAGYNAGPGRVSGWIKEFGDPRTGQIDWIDWIELIPISETRNYVQRVIENYEIYTHVRY